MAKFSITDMEEGSRVSARVDLTKRGRLPDVPAGTVGTVTRVVMRDGMVFVRWDGADAKGRKYEEYDEWAHDLAHAPIGVQ